MMLIKQLFNLTKCLLLLSSFYFNPLANAAVTWETINPNIQFLKQQPKLRFYDSNQVLITGDKCALLVDASGNFAAVEQLARHLKQRLKTPLCYLLATHNHDDHLLGMAVMQHFYPTAQLLVHQQVKNEFTLYQQAFDNKLQGYEKSIELSYQRLATLPAAQQAQWRVKLQRAKERLFRWQKYQLNAPAIAINTSRTLDLGNFEITLNARQAHTNGDLTISTNNGSILIGGDIVDWLPYPGHGNLARWQLLLQHYINDPQLNLILPGHGEQLSKSQLQQPLSFLTAITAHVEHHPKQSVEQLVLSFPKEVLLPYQQDALSSKSSKLFLAAGLQRVKTQNNEVVLK